LTWRTCFIGVCDAAAQGIAQATRQGAARATECRLRRHPTDQRILDAVRQLMQAHGYHGVSYAAIAAQVGIRTVSVFHHVPTKEDLARAAVACYRGTLRAGLTAIDDTGDDPRVKLECYAGFYRGLPQRRGHMCLGELLVVEATTLPGPVRAEARASFTAREAWLGEVLAAGRAAGLLRVGEPLAAALVVAGIEGALLVAHAHDDDAHVDAVVARLLSTFHISG